MQRMVFFITLSRRNSYHIETSVIKKLMLISIVSVCTGPIYVWCKKAVKL